jgi:hypothetical protein
MDLEFKQVDKGERSRTYIFAQGEFTIKNAVRVCQRPSGGQRVEDGAGMKYVIPPGWLAIKLDMDEWSF